MKKLSPKQDHRKTFSAATEYFQGRLTRREFIERLTVRRGYLGMHKKYILPSGGLTANVPVAIFRWQEWYDKGAL